MQRRLLMVGIIATIALSISLCDAAARERNATHTKIGTEKLKGPTVPTRAKTNINSYYTKPNKNFAASSPRDDYDLEGMRTSRPQEQSQFTQEKSPFSQQRGPNQSQTPTRSKEAIAKDRQLLQQIEKALMKDPKNQDQQLSVEIENGNVILQGGVTSAEDIRRIESVIRSIRGIKSIENNLQVQPTGDKGRWNRRDFKNL